MSSQKRLRSSLGNGVLSSRLTHEPLPYQHMAMAASSQALQQQEEIYDFLNNLLSGDRERMALMLMQLSIAIMSDRQVTMVTGRSKMDVTCSCASAAAAADAAAGITNAECMSDSAASQTPRTAACGFRHFVPQLNAASPSRWPSSSTMK